ncbi:MAG: hypothetical protein WBB23_23590 [Desulforhopalus sp.]
MGSKQVTPKLIPEQRPDPGFDAIPTLSTHHQRFTHVRLHEPYLIPSCGTFSSTLTTMALYHSSLRWFETCSCKPVPRGLPSSLVQHGYTGCATSHTLVCLRDTRPSAKRAYSI